MTTYPVYADTDIMARTKEPIGHAETEAAAILLIQEYFRREDEGKFVTSVYLCPIPVSGNSWVCHYTKMYHARDHY